MLAWRGSARGMRGGALSDLPGRTQRQHCSHLHLLHGVGGDPGGTALKGDGPGA